MNRSKESHPHPFAQTSFIKKIALIFFGTLLALAIFEIGLRLAGMFILSMEEHRNLKFQNEDQVVRILCLGESTTMLGGNNSYPRQLEAILNKKGAPKRFQVINKGIPGTDTTTIVRQLKENIAKYKPTLIITMMGINDEVLVEQGIKPQQNIRTFYDDLRTVKLMRLLRAHLYYPKYAKSGTKEELDLIREIWLKPQDPWAYQELDKLNSKNEKDQNSEEYLRLAVKVNPQSFWAYELLGNCLLRQNKVADAEKLAQNAIKKNPSKSFGYQILGVVLVKQGRFHEMEGILRRALKHFSDSPELYSLLGQYYLQTGQWKPSQEVFEHAIRLDPKGSDYYEQLGLLFGAMNNFKQCEAMFEKAVELNDEDAVFNLTDWYVKKGEFVRAEEFLKKLQTKYSNNNRFDRSLRHLYEKWGKADLALSVTQKADDLSQKTISPVTVDNYQKVARMAKDHKIQLIAMQYPMRSLKTLMTMLNTFPEVIFVGNEENFKEGLSRGPYEDYFKDSFAGDFGHCTPLGNWLIAQNLAKIILKIELK